MVDRERLTGLYAAEVERFEATHPRSATLASEARGSLLAGVPMPWMTRWPGSYPLTFAHAEGARITDVDGHEYIDFALGDTGAMPGHSLPAVASAIAAQAQRGLTTMLPSEDAAWVGAELSRRFGAGLTRWQFTLSATDANRFVLRFARALTGRPRIAVVNWCYHGTVDETLAVLGAGAAPSAGSPTGPGAVIPRPGALGPQVPVSETTAVVEFNDLPALEARLALGDVACLLIEPAMTNIGIVLPEPGYLEAVREITRQYGVLLVIDETHTLCLGPGGATAAWGLEPDLLVVGKAIGGGVPIGTYGMTVEVATRLEAAMLAEEIDVAGVGGTLSGNALSLAAARATLANALRPEDFALTIPLAEAWATGVQAVITEEGLPWSVQQLGSRAEYWFCPAPRNGGEAAARDDHDLAAYFHLHALNRGVLLTPFHNMALLSPAHSAADVERHREVFATAAAELRG